MWHSTKVITTFDWLKSISRQRHSMCGWICVCVCVYLSMHIYLNFISFMCLCICVFRLYRYETIRFKSSKVLSCSVSLSLSLSLWLSLFFSLSEIYHREPAIDVKNRHTTSINLVMVGDVAQVLCTAALFREINFKWVTDAVVYMYIRTYVYLMNLMNNKWNAFAWKNIQL